MQQIQDSGFSAAAATGQRHHLTRRYRKGNILQSRNLGLAELLRQLPDGLHTQVGQGGAGLSGGQRQMIEKAKSSAAASLVFKLV